jgi:hypothetical protein
MEMAYVGVDVSKIGSTLTFCRKAQPLLSRATAKVSRNSSSASTPDLDELLQRLGYRTRLRQQYRALSLRNVEEIETRFDLSRPQVETALPSLAFLAVVKRVCRVKSFEVVSGGEH